MKNYYKLMQEIDEKIEKESKNIKSLPKNLQKQNVSMKNIPASFANRKR